MLNKFRLFKLLIRLIFTKNTQENLEKVNSSIELEKGRQFRLKIIEGCEEFNFYNNCFVHFPEEKGVPRRDIFTREQLKELPMIKEIDGLWYMQLQLEVYDKREYYDAGII